jgi:hypothetical protein
MRWKPRQGLFANLVAGSVEWRRILILQSVGTATTLESALDKNVRLGFITVGGYWRRARWRYLFGALWFLPAAYYSWHFYTTPPNFLLIGAEVIAILSLCYLLTMAFVTGAFLRAKKTE